jgi:hypothetical protein
MSTIDPAIFEGPYQFTMQDDSMAPMVYAGQIVAVDPTRSPEPGKGIVLFKADRSERLVRRLVRSTPTQWIVHQFGEARIGLWKQEQTLLREDWPIAEFISGVCLSR